MVERPDVDVRIRKVRVLQGRALEEAKKLDLKDEDLVIVTTTVGSLPKYQIEKIEGSPIDYLLKKQYVSADGFLPK